MRQITIEVIAILIVLATGVNTIDDIAMSHALADERTERLAELERINSNLNSNQYELDESELAELNTH